jgi:pyruvate dehydrogenase E1 component alpha subunit
VAAGSRRDPVELQAARVGPDVRARIDAEIDELLDEAERFVAASPVPDPAGATDLLYATGLPARPGAV